MSISLHAQDHWQPLVYPHLRDPHHHFALRFFAANKLWTQQNLAEHNSVESPVPPVGPTSAPTLEPLQTETPSASGDTQDTPATRKHRKVVYPTIELHPVFAVTPEDDKPLPFFTSYAGGTVTMPFTLRQRSLQHIAYDLQTESTSYWNQIAHEACGERFVVDLDAHDRVLTDSEIHTLAVLLHRGLRDHYTDHATQPILLAVSKCGPRLKKKRLSTGLHFVAHVRVSHDQAKQIIFGFNILLKLHKFPMQGLTVDTSIYRDRSHTLSLRLVYSHKIDPCPICDNGIQKTTCIFCDHRGSVISKHTYKPVALLDGTGEHNPSLFDERHQDFYTLLCTHSIWPEPNETRTDFTRPDGEALYTIALPQAEAPHRPTGMTATQYQRRLKASALPATHPAYTQLTHTIQNLQHNHKKLWPKVVIQTIEVAEDKHRAFIELESHSLGCSFCPYAMKDHGGNRIYFQLIKPGRLTVFCRSEKAEYGCKKKERIVFTIPSTLTAEIMGQSVPPKLLMAHSTRPKGWKDTMTEKTLQEHPQSHTEHRATSHRSEAEKHRIEKENHIRKLQELYGLRTVTTDRVQATNTFQARSTVPKPPTPATKRRKKGETQG